MNEGTEISIVLPISVKPAVSNQKEKEKEKTEKKKPVLGFLKKENNQKNEKIRKEK